MLRFFSLCLMVFSASTFAGELSLLSLNVFMLPKPLKQSLQPVREVAIPEALKAGGHDLIFLQEAFMGSFRFRTRAILKATHPHEVHLNKWRGSPFFSSGLQIFSRFPFRILGWDYFRSCAEADCFSAKGVILLEVTFPSGKKIQVANTHLQAGRSNGEIRRTQMQEIKQLLDRYAEASVPQLLAGDLNISETDPEFSWSLDLLALKPIPLRGSIRTTSSRVNPCYKTGNSPHWVDHVWYRGLRTGRSTALRVRELNFEYQGKTCPLSDHHAVESHLRF